jgi:hypothetical protein
MPTKSTSSGARRADITSFDVPEHHGDGFGVASARPKRRSHLSLEIGSSGGCRLNNSATIMATF